jgi:RNA polymerase sigma-70 factor, ECF subfamily
MSSVSAAKPKESEGMSGIPATGDQERLIRTAQLGDRDAFSRLISIYGKSVYILARFYCRKSEDAEDLSQEVWLRVWRSLAGFRWQASFQTWLRQIVVHTFLNCRRSSSLERTGRQVEYDGAVDSAEFGTPGGEQVMIANILAGRIREALRDLPDRQRLMFILKHQEGLTYQEIGNTLGCSTGTAKKAIFRATQFLRSRLGPSGGQDTGVER